MAAVEVCVVAWLAWRVVAGLLGVVWAGSVLVLGWSPGDFGEFRGDGLGHLGF